MANIAKINGIVPAKVNGIVPAKVNGMGFSRGLYPYPIPNGVRLNGVDEYLSRTPASAGSRKQWTLSKWGKLGVKSYDWAGFSAYDATDSCFIYYRSGTGIALYNNSPYANVNFPIVLGYSYWFHLLAVLDTTQAALNDRFRVWINGTQLTPSWTENIDQDDELYIGATVAHSLGRQHNTAYGDGYHAEQYFFDGQIHDDPSYFGEYRSGVWVPKEVSGLTYGANGYYFDFSDASDLGKDASGNGNDFAGAGIDATNQVEDTPTNNFCTLDPLANDEYVTLSNGNLESSQSGGGIVGNAYGSLGVMSGKWYWEEKLSTINGGFPRGGIIAAASTVYNGTYGGLGVDSLSWALTAQGYSINNDTQVSLLSSFSTDDIRCIAFDADAGKIWFGKNGAFSGDTEAGTGEAFSGITGDMFLAASCGSESATKHNFGNPTFSIASANSDENGHGEFEYAPPAGFLALCESNALSDTVVMTNLITGNETYDSIGDDGSNLPDKAADGSNSTYWYYPGTTTEFWWEVDFGAGNTEIALLASFRSWTGPVDTTDVIVKGSNDGSTWTTVGSMGTGWSSNDRDYFFSIDTSPGAYRYYRFYTTKSAAADLGIYEYRLYGAPKSITS